MLRKLQTPYLLLLFIMERNYWYVLNEGALHFAIIVLTIDLFENINIGLVNDGF